jgi:lysophospholipase L1-like esterase
MLGARNTLQEVIPGIGVDASVARMPGAFTGRVKKLAKKEDLANIVVIHSGTNGVLPEEILRATLDPLIDYQRVVVVNAAVPRSWEKANNAVVRAVAKDYPNVVIADWHTAAQGHREYFVSDGVHLTAKGARAYATVIKEAAGL